MNNVKYYFSHTWQVRAVALALAAIVLVLPSIFIFKYSTFQEQREEIVAPYARAPQAEVKQEEFSLAQVTDEILWLARAIYSETKRTYEQELVAWVIRNRVETAYRGKRTYQSVVLDPWQFSAFNRNSPKRRHYSSLGANSKAQGWDRALEIAHSVYHASETTRPFARNTRHFYSEQSMRGRRHPNWAHGKRPIELDRQVDPRRFRFFEGIA